MRTERLYRILDPEAIDTGVRVFQGAHHVMLALGIAVIFANTEPAWRQGAAAALDIGSKPFAGSSSSNTSFACSPRQARPEPRIRAHGVRG